MKFIKTLVAVAAVAAAFSAQAESNLNIVSGSNMTATARLNFQVVIPKILYLRVGSGTDFVANNTVDTVGFNLTPAQVATPGPVAGTSNGTVTARVVGNGNTTIALSALGVAGGLASAGLPSIPWSAFTLSATVGGLANPGIGNGVAGTAVSSAPTNGLVDRSGSWTFSYNNAAPIAAGTYGLALVTYTATMP